MKVLVGYATQHGSTREIAERIGSVLDQHGHRVEVSALEEVIEAGGYGGFVLGSAIHRQNWLLAARRFIEHHAGTLAVRPVWLFSVGMPAALPRRFRTWAATEEGKAIVGFRSYFLPRATRLFSGVYRPEHTPWPGRLLFRAMGGRFGDYRDWECIETWAREIAQALDSEPQAVHGQPREAGGQS